ncbi:uncharacterized protein LOC115621607 [Scaptodrosophila lebanonensis]|uniref:Uncharacterized protein LOC115621607 n=1 Tax=Drosophila lebanonensis TaxID=7225 RepID=A0A6J2T554_DROLE|nr:uncharacterized protein LOC115621607 [Scaptodrosophila lebanonensis]
MATVVTAETLAIGDIVFAKKCGYIPWPAKIIAKHSRASLVQFMSTNDRHRIRYSKIWPYNEYTKSEFITRETLDYEEFREAVFITERIRGVTEEGIIDAVMELLSPIEESLVLSSQPSPTIPDQPSPLSQEQLDLSYVYHVRQQSDSLNVEPQFIKQINRLRSSLTLTDQNYLNAQAAFLELQHLPISQLLLIRNYDAVDTIRQLCRFRVPYSEEDELTADDLAELQQDSQNVRTQANHLFVHFASKFKQPFSQPNFWSEYCRLTSIYRRYTVAISAPETEGIISKQLQQTAEQKLHEDNACSEMNGG